MASVSSVIDKTCMSMSKKSAILVPRDAFANEDHPHPTASIFIILSAKAYSCVGFGLSLLAIWFSWVVPIALLNTAAPSPVDRPHTHESHRRARSVGHKPKPPPSRRLSAPVSLPSALIFGESERDTQRHVSWVDSPPLPSRQQSGLTDTGSVIGTAYPSPPPESQLFSTSLSSSPLSSLPSLPDADGLPTPPPEEALTLPLTEQPGPSTVPPSGRAQPSPVFRKLRLPFHSRRKKANGEPESAPTTPTQIQVPLPEPSSATRRSFMPPWSHHKKNSTHDSLDTSLETSSQSSYPLSRQSTSNKASTISTTPTNSSFTLLPKKAQRQTSTPIPRTMPYGAPYFATPPLPLDDSYPAYLRRLPQFEDEVAPAIPSDLASNSKRDRTSSAPSYSLPSRKRRTTSEDWSPHAQS